MGGNSREHTRGNLWRQGEDMQTPQSIGTFEHRTFMLWGDSANHCPQTGIISLKKKTPQMSFLRMQPGIFMLLLITGLLPAVYAAAMWIKQLIRQRQHSCSLSTTALSLSALQAAQGNTCTFITHYLCDFHFLKPYWCGISCDNTGGRHPQLHCNPLSTPCHWSLPFYRIFFKETP